MSSPLTSAAPGDVVNVGSLGGESEAYSINNAGQVAGRYLMRLNPNTAAWRAFRYAPGPGGGDLMEDLGTLGGVNSQALGINDLGQVTGSATIAGDRVSHAFRYTGAPGSPGNMEDLGTLGGNFSQGQSINNFGQVAGGSYLGGDFFMRAFRFTGAPGTVGVMEHIGSFGGQDSYAFGINNSGQVTGYADTPGTIKRHTFLYSGPPGAAVMTDVDDAGITVAGLGGPYIHGHGMAINDTGQIAGYRKVFGAHQAVLYSGTPGPDWVVGLNGMGGTINEALGINEQGFVVGVVERPFDVGGGTSAALWLTDTDHTFVNLDTWLDDTNPTQGAYWSLSRATDINDFGLITGYGNYDDGPGGLSDGQRAFVLDASGFVVPEPGAAGLVGIAGATMLLRRRRRSQVWG
jgi:probable HAF family extracellular repeat protein